MSLEELIFVLTQTLRHTSTLIMFVICFLTDGVLVCQFGRVFVSVVAQLSAE